MLKNSLFPTHLNTNRQTWWTHTCCAHCFHSTVWVDLGVEGVINQQIVSAELLDECWDSRSRPISCAVVTLHRISVITSRVLCYWVIQSRSLGKSEKTPDAACDQKYTFVFCSHHTVVINISPPPSKWSSLWWTSSPMLSLSYCPPPSISQSALVIPIYLLQGLYIPIYHLSPQRCPLSHYFLCLSSSPWHALSSDAALFRSVLL